ncbi:MAG: hypothetical protein D6768_12465 [Chloroflexi bacterium]|nr:MAG: hypothetical protein D6768_12465 [Chloroflexota bacterium]
MKHLYESPELTVFGSVESITLKKAKPGDYLVAPDNDDDGCTNRVKIGLTKPNGRQVERGLCTAHNKITNKGWTLS